MSDNYKENQDGEEYTPTPIEIRRYKLSVKIKKTWLHLFFFALGWGVFCFLPSFIKIDKDSVLLMIGSVALCGLPIITAFFRGGLSGVFLSTDVYHKYSDGTKKFDTGGSMGSMVVNLFLVFFFILTGFLISLIKVLFGFLLIPLDIILILTTRDKITYVFAYLGMILLPYVFGIVTFLGFGIFAKNSMVVMDPELLKMLPLWLQ